MAKVAVTELYLLNIAKAIRSRRKTTDTYKPSEMATAITKLYGTPCVSGELSSTTAETKTITTGYVGAGYPILLVITVKDGLTASGTWSDTIQRYAVGQFVMTKAYAATRPTYTTSGTMNYGYVATTYKNSTSSATSLSRTGSTTANSFTSSSTTASASSSLCARFQGQPNKLSVHFDTSTYGFMPNVTYQYFVVYSQA